MLTADNISLKPPEGQLDELIKLLPFLNGRKEELASLNFPIQAAIIWLAAGKQKVPPDLVRLLNTATDQDIQARTETAITRHNDIMDQDPCSPDFLIHDTFQNLYQAIAMQAAFQVFERLEGRAYKYELFQLTLIEIGSEMMRMGWSSLSSDHCGH